MKPSFIIILMLVAVVVGTAIWATVLRNKPQKPDFKTTDEMMKWLSTQAVEMAHKNCGEELDFSTQSIEKVDVILGKIHDEYQKTKTTEGVMGLAMAYGAYIGEVIRRVEPEAKWAEDDPVGGKKSYPIHTRNGNAYVCGWCYKRILNGEEDNVWFKYQALEHYKSGTNAVSIRKS